ncbi:MAG: hypothetical protein HN929_14025 [Chloroflexi bacterium]|jgi:hypothetical protein|nr:hypothetical protein [Chloroflexota bacterium]
MNIYKKGDIFECQFEYSGEGWEQWVLLMSDEHFDSPDCDRSLLKRHHEEAKAKNAPIFKFGDVFDCMGGKYDPRTHKGDIRPEHNVKDYFDAITRDAAKFYEPYDIPFISDGNHEENVLKRHETDLIGNLTERLKCARGLYDGFLRFSFTDHVGSGKRKYDVYYNHGGGGNSPVTKGVISTNRRGVAFDADIFVSGHNHNRWNVEIMRTFVDKMGNVKSKAQNHINMGTYKGTPANRSQFESNFPAPNMGGVWLRFSRSYHPHDIKVQVINA